MHLVEFDFVTEHRPRTQNTHRDALCNYPQAEPIYAVDLAEGSSLEVLRGKQARDKPCCGVAKALKTRASLRANFFAALGSPHTSSFTAGMPWSRSRCRSPCARRPPTILLHAPQRDCPSDVPSTSTRNGTHLTREHLEVFGFELVDNALTPAVLKLISECRLVRWKLGRPLLGCDHLKDIEE